MRTILGFLSLVLAACSTSNPWFEIDDGQFGQTSTGSGSTVTSMTSMTSMTSPTGSSATDDTSVDPTTGQPATVTSDATGVTSTTDASSSTQPVEPSTSSSGSSGAGDTDSSSSGTTAADSSTGDTTDSTTGEPPIEAYYLLYPLCPVKETEWTAGPKADLPLMCMETGMAPEVLQQPLVMGLFNLKISDVLELAPSLEAQGSVVGAFGPFVLTAAQQLDAELFTGVLCASSNAVGACEAVGSIWVRTGGKDLMKVIKPVKNGGVTNLSILLYTIPGINNGDPFEVYLRADVGAEPNIEDRLWFVNPRIRPQSG